MSSKMFVVKRDGRKEPVMFDKITSRIQKLCYGLNMDYIDPPSITLKVISGLYSGVPTVQLDDLAAETAVMLSNEHPDYAILAARIEVSNLHKETKKSFSEVVEDLYNAGLAYEGQAQNKLTEKIYNIVKKNADKLNSSIIYDRDFSYTYFGFKILENHFLKRINGKVVERPQHMLMRIAVAIHEEEIDAAIETYNLLSERWYMQAPTTMINAGFKKGQLLSNYSLTMKSDSIEGIYDTVKEFGLIARSGGTTGLNVHCIRATGSYIAGTNGTSNGIVPMLRVYNSTARYAHQGGKKETGALTVYLEPWHADVQEFLNLKKGAGKEEQRAKDLSYALWIPDIFMRRVEKDEDWCLMCPHDSADLHKLYGEKFEEAYTAYEKEGRFRKKIKARQLWYSIIESQFETGAPSMLYKDHCNQKSNHQNIGTIQSSSHSGEMMVFNSSDVIPSCGNAILSLEMFVQEKNFDFGKLKEVVKVVTRNLNKIIDVNCYPVRDAEKSNQSLRPVAIGVQGLADTFIRMRYPFDSAEAKVLNKQIFETIYFGAMEASCELAAIFGPYELYEGSPVSKGIFQYDMWNVTPTDLHDWASLKKKVAQHGVRNSVLLACMPTTSTAQILGCIDGIEALNSCISSSKGTVGDFKVINHHLLNDLTELGIWDDDLEKEIIANDGSIQSISRIPIDTKNLYKTVWEISQKVVLEMAADRGAFIDQSQSLNIHMPSANYGKLTSMHFYACNLGLKTGMVNLRTKYIANGPSANNTVKQATEECIDDDENNFRKENGTQTNDVETSNAKLSAMVCSLQNKDDCLMCGS